MRIKKLQGLVYEVNEIDRRFIDKKEELTKEASDSIGEVFNGAVTVHPSIFKIYYFELEYTYPITKSQTIALVSSKKITAYHKSHVDTFPEPVRKEYTWLLPIIANFFGRYGIVVGCNMEQTVKVSAEDANKVWEALQEYYEEE